MRPGYAILAVPVVSGVLALVWWAPWDSGADVIARAGAAFGTQAVVHVVARDAPPTRAIAGSDGVEVWYQPSRRRAHVVAHHNGKVVGDIIEVAPPGLSLSALVSPATLGDFVTSYRPRLAIRTFRAGGSARIQGRRVLWLRSPTLEVAVDPVSYQPIWIRDPGTTRLIHLAVAETMPLDPADFLTTKQKKARHL